MKTISPALKTHLMGEVTSLVTCWILTRRDAVRQAFTTHDRDIDYDNLTFRPVHSFLPTAVSSSNSLNVDNLEVSAALSSDALSARDIQAGLYDHARISIFQLNWQDLSQGKLAMRCGWLGEFQLKDQYFTVEIRGLTQKMQQTIGAVFSPECRADLGGPLCHVNLEQFSVSGKVTAVTARDIFTDSARSDSDGWFDYGLIRWLSGANAGLKVEVKSFTAGQFTLTGALPNDINAGDLYLVQAGCDKRSATCKSKFQNFSNFQGEIAVPGTDALYDYPGFK